MLDLSFYKGKRVLVTGHTGFKGAWMCKVLTDAQADVTGYALETPTSPGLFTLLCLHKNINSVQGDIRDLDHLRNVFQVTRPEIVIHMAAQPIVRESYKKPVETYAVNVMGTVHMMECVRQTESVRSVVNVTTDKVYRNREWQWGYREHEELNGFDPYSNSKSCSELVTDSYTKSFFEERRIAISTARAGNVIGGGDFAADRIIPDCIRAVESGREIIVRNPHSVRPYQHVLEPVMAYLRLAQYQYEDDTVPGNYNIGPEECDCVETGRLVTCFCNSWNKICEQQISWKEQTSAGPHEANFLKLDCAKAKAVLGWKPVWHIEKAVDKIAEWTCEYFKGGSIARVMEQQIKEYKGEYNDV